MGTAVCFIPCNVHRVEQTWICAYPVGQITEDVNSSIWVFNAPLTRGDVLLSFAKTWIKCSLGYRFYLPFFRVQEFPLCLSFGTLPQTLGLRGGVFFGVLSAEYQQFSKVSLSVNLN